MTDQEETKKIVAEMNTELKPFLDGIRMAPKTQLEIFREAYAKFSKRSKYSTDLWFSITHPEEDIGENAEISEQVRALYGYLGLVESLGNCYVDILVMLLVASGRDFHIEAMHSTPRIRHVVSIEDLENERVALTTKLNFLKNNGLPFFVSLIDNKLRNDIAHLNCNVVNGKILVRGKSIDQTVGPSRRKLTIAVIRVSHLLFNLAVDLGWEKQVK